MYCMWTQMSRQWMYMADRRSKEFMDGMHEFIEAAEKHKYGGFVRCPCKFCKNEKDYSSSRTIHSQLFNSGFMPNYYVWTKHCEGLRHRGGHWVLCWLCGRTLPNWDSSITSWGAADWKGHTWKKISKCHRSCHGKAHLTVLQQSALVAPYMEEHIQIVRSMYPLKSET